MMKLAKGLLALALAAASAVAPAHADTVVTSMGGTAWQKIGDSGAALEIQNNSTTVVQVTTAAALPSMASQGQPLKAGERRCWIPTGNVYAFADPSSGAKPQVAVTTNTGCASSGGGGGGGSTGSVTAAGTNGSLAQAIQGIAGGVPLAVTGNFASVGTTSNAADGQATTTSNNATMAWNALFNGSTWDRARGDVTNGAWVNVKASALPAGAASSAPQGPTAPGTAANASILGGCIYNSTAPTLTAGQQVAVQCDAAGNLKISGGTGGGSGGSVTQGTSPWVDNITQLGGAAVATGAGASGAGTLRIVTSTDSSLTANIGNTNGLALDATEQAANSYLATLVGVAQASPDGTTPAGLGGVTSTAVGVVGPSSFDTQNYNSVQVTGSVSSGTYQYQDSNTTAAGDFQPVAGNGNQSVGGSADQLSVGTSGSWCFPVKGRYGRLYMSQAGSATVTVTLRSAQCAPRSVAVANFPASQPVTNAGAFPVQNTAATPAGSNQIGALLDNVAPAGFPATAAATGVIGPASFSTAGFGSFDLSLSGTWVGSVSFQGSTGDGTWYNLYCNPLNGYGLSTEFASGSTNGIYNCPAAPLVRLQVTAYTSGTISATVLQRSHPYVGRGTYVGNVVAAAEQGSSSSTVGITPVSTGATNATVLVAKASAGNLYRVTATNFAASAQYLALVQLAAAPAASAAITPLYCISVPPAAAANTAPSVTVDTNFAPGPPPAFANGIVALLTTSCSTYTAGAAGLITALVR